MNIRAQIIIAVLILVAMVAIVNMIRKKALELRYALAWILTGIGILILDIFPGIMDWISDFMGIASPMNMLFFLGFCFMLVIIFGLTAAVSKMSVQIKQLSQELALHEKRQEEKHINQKVRKAF